MGTSNKSRPNKSKTRTKVKTGCRTCKIRKVKCDEGRPACHRCVSTGRVCDGYGIWGGGGNAYGDRSAARESCNKVILHNPQTIIGDTTPECYDYLQWFMHRTILKFPGACLSGFWETLVFQGCAAEPAVRHAVVALSSAHKRESLEEKRPLMTESTPDLQQRFTLQEYCQAIHHLRPHFAARTRRSIHVALITCAVFSFLETFLERYNAGIAHLQSGLKLLTQNQLQPFATGDNTLILQPPRGFVDDWLIEIFVRLHVTAALFGQIPPHLFAGLQVFPSEPLPCVFESVKHATQCLNRLLGEVLCFGEQCSLLGHPQDTHSLNTAINEQRRLRSELNSWDKAHSATKTTTASGINCRDAIQYQLLQAYSTMAKIMINTSVCPTYEYRFENHTDDFLRLLRQAIDIWRTAYSVPVWYVASGEPPKICTAIGDKGWIPLLYYVALKCRVHRLRVQAMRLLSTTPGREGIWNGALVVRIVREVVRIEEQDFYDGFAMDDEFPVDQVPEKRDLFLPPLPESYRLHDVRVILPDHAMEKTMLRCRRKGGDGVWEYIAREYDPLSQCWKDVMDCSPSPLEFPDMRISLVERE
ncbi:hypothetical protein F5X96DRAFT_632660 [Biscogniauxia mediterranea]|nr:hypothetical protein F5X96DRAFT_632660 [Biscogniauxia mediterranea]